MSRYFLLAILFILVPMGTPSASTQEGIFRYTISHSLHGDIGNFTNTISQSGPNLVVETKLRIAAGIMGIVMRRIEEDRREIWRDGRLVAYMSDAKDNDELTKLRGQAQDESFVIEGPNGRNEAPPEVRTTNPWSEDIVKAQVLMGTKKGDLNRVSVSGGEQESVEIADRTVPARHYRIEGDLERDLWYGPDGVLLKIEFPAADGTVAFTLERRCAPDQAPGGESATQC